MLITNLVKYDQSNPDFRSIDEIAVYVANHPDIKGLRAFINAYYGGISLEFRMGKEIFSMPFMGDAVDYIIHPYKPKKEAKPILSAREAGIALKQALRNAALEHQDEIMEGVAIQANMAAHGDLNSLKYLSSPVFVDRPECEDTCEIESPTYE